MVYKYNQIVIEKVENGFVMSVQTKDNSGFLGMKCVDKKHYIAKDVEDLVKQVKNISSGLVTTEQLEKLLEEEEEDEE